MREDSKIIIERGDITTYTTEVQRIIRDYMNNYMAINLV
jgi:hypothetical protein